MHTSEATYLSMLDPVSTGGKSWNESWHYRLWGGGYSNTPRRHWYACI